MHSFPKLLVATEFPPNAGGGGAAIVRQMVKDWPAEKLFWWSCRPDQRQHFGHQVAQHNVAAIPPKWLPSRRWRRAKSWVLESLWVPRAAKHLRQTLAEIKPEVVWAIPHSWSIPPLAQILPGSGTGFHASVHDYPDLKNQIAGLGVRRCQHWAGAVEELYARATSRDAICLAMVNDLRDRTGATGAVARAGLESEDFEYLSGKAAVAQDRIRIAYPGTIIVEKEFTLFVRTLDRIRRKLPRQVSLDFFGDHSYRACGWFDPAWMTEHGNLAATELLAELKKCTWGFVPMGLSDDDPRYNRFSLPTKFVSYLQAGLPVISLGHPESSVMEMTSAYPVGVSHADGDTEKFGQKMLAALSVSQPWEKFGPEILRCARQEFDAQKMRTALRANFQNCATVTNLAGQLRR